MERNPLIVIPAGTDDTTTTLATWRRASAAGIGCVIVDCDDDEMAEAMAGAGAYVCRGEAGEDDGANYRTPSGAERVAATVNRFDRFYNHDIVVNLGAGHGALDTAVIRALMYPLASLDVDIATVVRPISDDEAADEGIAKVAVGWQPRRRVHVLAGARIGRARNFSHRVADIDGPPWFRHLPIYAYKRASLDRFVRTEPSLRELEERLEPMRALESGMRIDVVLIEGAALDVENETDLERARKAMAMNSRPVR